MKDTCCSDNVIVFTLVSINKYIIFRRGDRWWWQRQWHNQNESSICFSCFEFGDDNVGDDSKGLIFFTRKGILVSNILFHCHILTCMRLLNIIIQWSWNVDLLLYHYIMRNKRVCVMCIFSKVPIIIRLYKTFDKRKWELLTAHHSTFLKSYHTLLFSFWAWGYTRLCAYKRLPHPRYVWISNEILSAAIWWWLRR